MPMSPPLIVALTKSELAQKYDFSSLQLLVCGGAPLSKEVVDRFRTISPAIFPLLCQTVRDSLVRLRLEDNKFSGEIPLKFSTLTDITYVDYLLHA
ncbi:hypothetical protein FF1_033364 [Malus domestica]